MNVSNIVSFKVMSETSRSWIKCRKLSGFNFQNVSKIQIVNLNFCGCGVSYFTPTLSTIKVQQSFITLEACVFIHSNGTVIEAHNSNIAINQCIFNYSYVGLHNSNCNKSNGISSTGVVSALLISNCSVANFSECTFHGNSNFVDAVIQVNGSNIKMYKCEITNNTGRVIYSSNSTVEIQGCHFKYNCAKKLGMLQIESSRNLIINSTDIEDNEANMFQDLVLSVQGSLANISGLVIRRNKGIVVAFIKSTVNVVGNFMYSDNFGTLLIRLSDVSFNGVSHFLRNVQPWPTYYGGAVTSSISTVNFNAKTAFSDNWSKEVGGAIWSSGSKLFARCKLVITNNTAGKKGGGIYLYHSELFCHNCTITGNHASDRGGGIHASSSRISVGSQWKESEWIGDTTSTLVFASNNATTGGGLSLEANSKLYAFGESDYWYDIVFKNNTAEIGIAIFVDDNSTNFATCNCTYSNTYSVENECFLQTPFFIKYGNVQPGGSVSFSESRSLSNIMLFGGLLDRCTVYHNNDVYSHYNHKVDGVTHLKEVSKNENITALVSSDAVRVCFCDDINMPDCAYTPPSVRVEKGREFPIKYAAVDQVNRTVSATVYVSLSSTESKILTRKEVTVTSCTTEMLSVTSPHDTEELSFYAKGPCKGTGISKSKIKINFEKCSSTCPVGFQPLENSTERCECQCDSRIVPHITQCYEHNCTLLREHNFWINYINETNNTGFLFHQNCPSDYCLPATNAIYINLNIHNGADAQCDHNRSGLLCGSCKSGFSLSLGSSHCVQCNSYWPGVFTAILIGTILSGIGLVAFVLLINLTVAVGTLNGLIFYANIIFANAKSFLPFRNQNFFTIFIAWLNLSVGLDTCFVKGLDAYAKVWLELTFPIYIIVVLGIMILITKNSSRFTQFIGKGNPVATFATLIFLSYAKLLSIIIDVYSLVVLKYPNGSQVAVWRPDASVKYLQGKHVPLFLTATVIVIMGLAYTVLLFSWQWLLRAPNKKIFNWIRSTRLNLFMEANLAPYQAEYRYWTGLLLFVRIVLYLEIAMDTSTVTDSLIAIGTLVIGLVILKTYLSGHVYRKRILDHLNSFSYFNLLMFCLAKWYCQKSCQCQKITAKVSVTMAFLVFLGIILYHILRSISETKYGSCSITTIHRETKFVLKLAQYLNINLSHHHDSQTEVLERVTSVPSSSVVGLSPQHSSLNEEDVLKSNSATDQFDKSETYPIRCHLHSLSSLQSAQRLPKKSSDSSKYNTSLRETLLEQSSH